MPFAPPATVLSISLWRAGGVGGAYAAPDLTFMATLSQGRRVLEKVLATPGPAGNAVMWSELLCPKLTDVRAIFNNIIADLVEVPAGSKLFYDVMWVGDVGKGFLNEYRLALIQLRTNPAGTGTAFGFAFPVPMP